MEGYGPNADRGSGLGNRRDLTQLRHVQSMFPHPNLGQLVFKSRLALLDWVLSEPQEFRTRCLHIGSIFLMMQIGSSRQKYFVAG
jgi:hypothetical protein